MEWKYVCNECPRPCTVIVETSHGITATCNSFVVPKWEHVKRTPEPETKDELAGIHEELDWCTHKCQEIDALRKEHDGIISQVRERLAHDDDYIEAIVRRTVREMMRGL